MYLHSILYVVTIHLIQQNFRLVKFESITIPDNKINIAEKSKFLMAGVESIVGKGENADDQHFLLFTQCFLKVFISGS